MKWRMEPEVVRKLADGLAAAVVVSIPWSTSASCRPRRTVSTTSVKRRPSRACSIGE